MENLEQKIVEAVHVLPDDKKAEVLEFAENLKEDATTANGTESVEEVRQKSRRKKLMSMVGIAKSGRGDLSEKVDEILAEGANREEGWSLP